MTKSVEILEKKIWDEYFSEALRGCGQEVENSNMWWTISERDTVDIIKRIFGDKKFNLLEAGCGSGGTNFSLAKELNVTGIDLMDISEKALKYADAIRPKDLNIGINYILGSILDEPNGNLKYDLVWNTGLIEHYDKCDIIKIINNMLNLTKTKGFVVIGIPNRKNIAVLKASFLGKKFSRKYLSFIKGYRNTTETLYPDKEIRELIRNEFKNIEVFTEYAGSPLFVGTPTFIVNIFDKIFKRTKFSFLTYFIIKKGI